MANKKIDAARRLMENAGQVLKDTRAEYKAKVKEWQSATQYADEWKAQNINKLNAQHREDFFTFAQVYMTRAQDYRQAVLDEWRRLSEEHQATIDNARYPRLRDEYAFKLSTAQTPRDFEKIRANVQLTNDPTARLAFRMIALTTAQEKFAKSSNPDLRLWANGFMLDLQREDEMDKPENLLEVETERQQADATVENVKRDIRARANEIEPEGFLKANIAREIVGDPKPYEVVMPAQFEMHTAE